MSFGSEEGFGLHERRLSASPPGETSCHRGQACHAQGGGVNAQTLRAMEAVMEDDAVQTDYVMQRHLESATT